MKSKDGSCPVCFADNSTVKGTSKELLYSECKDCGYIFWEVISEIVGEPIKENRNDKTNVKRIYR